MTTATATTEAHAEATRNVTLATDSVFVHDSVYVYATTERTVEIRWRTSWRERTVHDTVIVHTTDTIRETVETRADPTATDPRKEKAGWTVALALFAAITVYTTIKAFLKNH